MTDASTALSELRTELEVLRAEVAQLRAATPGPETPPPATGTAPGGRHVTRRGLLAATVAGGAGLVATQLTAASPAAAATGDDVVLGAVNDAGATSTTLTASPKKASATLDVKNPDPKSDSLGIYALVGSSTGRFDPATYDRAAVVGESNSATGVAGISAEVGVRGTSVYNIGVWGVSQTSYGVVGQTASHITEGNPSAGVLGSAYYVPGVIASSTVGTALLAIAEGALPAVNAASTQGIGVQAKGGRAPLRLVPATTAGAPTTGKHLVGELFVDKTGTLFFCKNSGTPGTWKTVTLS